MSTPNRIRFQCPHCSKPLHVAAQNAGKSGRCPSRACGRPFTIPMPLEEVAERTRRNRWPLVAVGVVMILAVGVGVGIALRTPEKAEPVAAADANTGRNNAPPATEPVGKDTKPPSGLTPVAPKPTPVTPKSDESEPPKGKKDESQGKESKAALRPVVSEGWKRFVSKKGGFAVDFPPKSEDEPEEFSPGMVQAAIKDDFFSKTYLCYSAYSGDIDTEFGGMTPKETLDKARDSVVKGLSNGKLESVKNITLGVHQGREIEVVTYRYESGVLIVNGKHISRTRIYLVGKRYFLAKVVGDAESVSEKGTNLFLDSLQLLQ